MTLGVSLDSTGMSLTSGHQECHFGPSCSLLARATKPFFLAGKLETHPVFHQRMKSGSSREQLVYLMSMDKATDPTYCEHAHLQNFAQAAPPPSKTSRPILTLK